MRTGPLPIDGGAEGSADLPKEGSFNGMDAKTCHEIFRKAVKDVVEAWRMYLPDLAKDDWVVQAYDSPEALGLRYPNPQAREAFVLGLLKCSRERQEFFLSEMARVNRDGLGYLELEKLCYVLPHPNKEETDTPPSVTSVTPAASPTPNLHRRLPDPGSLSVPRMHAEYREMPRWPPYHQDSAGERAGWR